MYYTQSFTYRRESDLNQKIDAMKMRYWYYTTKIVDVTKSNWVATVVLQKIDRVKDFVLKDI